MTRNLMSQTTIPFFVSIPHSGEKIPDQASWLKTLPEEILMSDVDRYVDWLYEPALQKLHIPFTKTEWHRYAVDLNRIPTDVDEDSVIGATKKSGSHADGYHWVMTKNEVRLMPQAISQDVHQQLTELIYEPFHQAIGNHYENFFKQGYKNVFQIDAHSMPSLGTRMHKDPGEYRAEIVVSDCLGRSCHPYFRDLVIAAYAVAGFKVGYNWPYVGGRVTEQYGKPSQGQQAIQVELNRSLYMDEKTKKLKPEAEMVKIKIEKALSYVRLGLLNLKI